MIGKKGAAISLPCDPEWGGTGEGISKGYALGDSLGPLFGLCLLPISTVQPHPRINSN